MDTKQSHQGVSKLERRRAEPKKNTDAILLLVGVLIAVVCVIAGMLLRVPQALDTVVSQSVAAQALFEPSDPQPTFHQMYPPKFGGDAGEWPTF